MNRAVLPNTSAREQWLLAGLVDRTTNHRARAPLLDGGADDDAHIGTDQPDFSQRSCWTGPVIVTVSIWCRGLALLTLI